MKLYVCEKKVLYRILIASTIFSNVIYFPIYLSFHNRQSYYVINNKFAVKFASHSNKLSQQTDYTST